jgi:hypothetical protein
MIPVKYRKFIEFNQDSVEGKLLMAALAVLTSIDKDDIRKGKYGGMNHPDMVMENIWDLANYIFHQKEHEEWLFVENRDNKISDILQE